MPAILAAVSTAYYIPFILAVAQQYTVPLQDGSLHTVTYPLARTLGYAGTNSMQAARLTFEIYDQNDLPLFAELQANGDGGVISNKVKVFSQHSSSVERYYFKLNSETNFVETTEDPQEATIFSIRRNSDDDGTFRLETTTTDFEGQEIILTVYAQREREDSVNYNMVALETNTDMSSEDSSSPSDSQQMQLSGIITPFYADSNLN